VKIDSIDHIVLTVKDVQAACDFYAKILGMQVVRFGKGRTALSFGSQKINLHEVGKEWDPKAHRPTAGSGDLCFITSVPIPQVAGHLSTCGVKVIEGPTEKTGARGPILSVYFRDPDLNLIEVSNYLV
jgi:catechol 2,3-dioxygenase-like lactoylglutathione lyase family enzyme